MLTTVREGRKNRVGPGYENEFINMYLLLKSLQLRFDNDAPIRSLHRNRPRLEILARYNWIYPPTGVMELGEFTGNQVNGSKIS